MIISLRSIITQKVLNYFFLNKNQKRYVNELARILDVDPKNLDRKLKEFEEIGLFISEYKGKERYYSLNHSFPLISEYEQIFKKTYGIEEQLKNILRKIKNINSVYIYGSFVNNSFSASSDIDLLIIGNHSSLTAQKAVLPLQKSIGREINIIDLTPKEFQQREINKNDLITEIFNNPTIRLI